jgi:hypothetical protein
MTNAEYMRKWRIAHPENKDYQREYHKKYNTGKNAEIARKRAREWYENNKERAKSGSLKHYHENKVLKGRAFGERSGTWKGDKVSYSGLHYWVARWKTRPDYCEFCNKTNVRFQWANKSHEYKRDLDDWINLCCKCHYHYDKQHLRKRDWHGKHK